MGFWGFLSICAIMIGICIMLFIVMHQKKEIKKLEIEEMKLARNGILDEK